jgi:hypothetical protein
MCLDFDTQDLDEANPYQQYVPKNMLKNSINQTIPSLL